MRDGPKDDDSSGMGAGAGAGAAAGPLDELEPPELVLVGEARLEHALLVALA